MSNKIPVLVKILALSVTLLISEVNAQTCPGSPGCLDSTFNGTGKQVVTTFGNGGTLDRDAAIQSDGKVVSLVNEQVTEIMLVRLNTDGSLDTTFGISGLVRTNWHFNSTLPSGYPNGLAIQVVNGEERLVVVGSWTVPQGKRSSVTMLRVDRYLSNGSVDTSFGTNGTVLVNKPSALAVAIQPTDNKIVTVGDLQAVVRLNENGSIDTTFGSDGATGAGQSGWDIMVLPTGRILIGGSYSSGPNTLMCVSALNPNGSVAADFGSGGRALANFYGQGSFGRAFDIGLDPFGNIIAGGIARRKNASIVSNAFAGARFTLNGQLDTSFNGTGMVTHSFSGFDNNGRGIISQSDGRLVLTGSTQTAATGPRDWAMVRFDPDGSHDTTFGSSGITTTDFGGSAEYSNSVRIWTDPSCNCEKIVMVGGTNVGAAFARYMTN